jgi:branched-chain amino acid transport system substrate-binding protein
MTHTRSRTRTLISLAVLLLLVAAVASSVTAQSKGTVKVGVPIPLSGRHAPFGEIIKNSFNLALAEVNAKGGVRGGSKLEFVIEDSRSDVQAARTVAEKLISQDKVVMMTGQYASADTFPTAQIAQQYAMPFLVSTAAADEITQKGWKYIFRMAQPASDFDNGLKDFMEKTVKPRTMVILHENTLFGTSTATAMKEWAAKAKVDVVMYEAYDAGSPDYKPLLIRVKQKNPDVIYMVSYLMDATLLMRQAKEVDLNPHAFAGAAAGFSILQFIEGAGDAAEHVFSSTMWQPTVPYPGAGDYYKSYIARFGSAPSYHGAQAYAATFVVADVLNRAASLGNDDIVKSLAATDLMTMYGRIKFETYGKYTNQTRLPTFVVQVQKGKFATVWPKEVSMAPAVYPTPAWSKR